MWSVSRDEKEALMRQLLKELSQTRRLAEDLISRLEHCKRNNSPASTAGMFPGVGWVCACILPVLCTVLEDESDKKI